SGPTLYKDNIYYIEVKWDGYAVANSNKKYQLQMGSWQPTWDTSDDWSRKEMLELSNGEYDGYSGEMAKAPYICVYSGDRLIGGTEPDGTVPNWSAGPGDVNMDAEITLADYTALRKYLIKKSKKLTDEKAADIDSNGKINIFDAVMLKRILIKLG
ncbi:MAG: dockerin type I repeat-containing protein, partial [Oscillospiraceae bacterium]|nr:dockerin type I repeat-containing protein [Oscillospiraceae bacterium]